MDAMKNPKPNGRQCPVEELRLWSSEANEASEAQRGATPGGVGLRQLHFQKKTEASEAQRGATSGGVGPRQLHFKKIWIL